MKIEQSISIVKQGLNMANQNGFKGYSLEDASLLNEAIKQIEEFISKETSQVKKENPELEKGF